MTSILKVDTLQDSGGNAILSSDGAGNLTTSSGLNTAITNAGFTGGITEADMWRLTTDLVGNADPISANLERVDTDGFSLLGTGMSVSSGIFTFPSTGFYLVFFNASQQVISTGDYCNIQIQTTTDNATYSAASTGYINSSSTATALNSSSVHFIFDVTNTSTHKVRFSVTQSDTGNKITGNTGVNLSFFTFIKLGDT